MHDIAENNFQSSVTGIELITQDLKRTRAKGKKNYNSSSTWPKIAIETSSQSSVNYP